MSDTEYPTLHQQVIAARTATPPPITTTAAWPLSIRAQMAVSGLLRKIAGVLTRVADALETHARVKAATTPADQPRIFDASTFVEVRTAPGLSRPAMRISRDPLGRVLSLDVEATHTAH